MNMKYTQREIYNKLDCIYDRHSKIYKQNSSPKQMCCMWSTSDPPDVIEDTEPFRDMEEAFGISIDEDDCLELYDMDLDEAVSKISDIIKQKR